MKMRGGLLFFVVLCFVLCLGIVNAEGIIVKDTAIRDIITPSQNAIFNLKIINDQGVTDTFEISYLDIDWRLEAEPKVFTIGSKMSKDIRVELIPIGEKQPNVYGVPLVISSTINDAVKEEHMLRINVLRYDDLVDLSFYELPTSFDTRMSNVIQVKIQNKHTIEIENIKINLKSPFFDETREINLVASESRILDFVIKLDEDTKKGDYSLNITAVYSGKTVKEVNDVLKIGAISDVKEGLNEESGFLIKRTTITKTNNGNSVAYEQFSHKVTWFEKLFTSASPNPNRIEKTGGGYLLIWNLKLEQGDSTTIHVITSYRGFLILVIIAVVIICLLIYFLRKEISIHKKVVTMRHEKDGTTIVKIMIMVKNNSLNAMQHIRIMESIHNILEEPTEFGTLRPTSVKKVASSAHMVWIIPMLKRGEERILSYKAKAKSGKVFIPIALVRYMIGRRSKTVKSNRVRLFR